MRKLLSLLLVAAMVLGLASTAFAFSDVTATAQVGPAEKLAALGILKGYEDGTFKPENPITRAEFAAVIVRAMGLESAAKLINNPTKFKDVTANYAWAYGYINIASSKGIIKGDPDGNFRPGDKVSYAEAVTMLLRAAGWDAACSQMDWPAGFVMKAVEFGLTEGVNFDANSPANRGEVAVMTYNTLTKAYIAQWNDTTKVYENSNTKFMAKYLNAEEKTVVVTKTNLVDANVAVGKVVTAEDGTMTVPAGVDVNALLGHEVRVIKVGDAYVYMKDAQPADRVLTGTIKTTYAAGTKAITVLTSSTDTTGTTKNFAVDSATPANVTTVLVRNNAVVNATGTPADFGNGAFAANDTVTVYLDANGNARYIVATAYSTWMRVTGIDVNGVNGATANAIVVGSNKYNVASNTVFKRDGKPATFADIKAGDIVYIAYTGSTSPFNAYSVDAYSTTVSGAIGTIAFNTANELTVTIGSTSYPVASGAQISVNGATATALNATTVAPVVGYAGTASLTKDGKIAYLKANTTALIGYYVSKNTTDGSTVTFAIRGANQTYNVAAAYKNTVFNTNYSTSNLYQLTQAADGSIITISGPLALNTNYKVLSVDTANKIVTLQSNGGTGTISTINYNDATFGLCGGTWANMTNLTAGSVISYVADANGAMAYYETYTAVPGSASGRLLGYVANADTSTTVYLESKGAVISYTSNTAWSNSVGLDTLTNKIVNVTLTGGKVTDVAEVVWTGPYTVVSISGTTYTLKDASNNYTVEDLGSASVYLADGTAKTLADVTVGDSIKIFKSGTTVLYVQHQ